MTSFSEEIENSLKTLDLRVTDSQVEQLSTYCTLFERWGSSHNLSTVSMSEFAERHIANSLGITFLEGWIGDGKVIDIGSGGGLPGIPLKILFPSTQLTLVESIKKKALFLELVGKELGLNGYQVVASRAEELAHLEEYRECFDVATCRAVAHLSIAAELCLPFVTCGGAFFALKGERYNEEIGVASKHLLQLGGQTPTISKHQSNSYILRIGKVDPTPTCFPRSSAVLKREQKKLRF